MIAAIFPEGDRFAPAVRRYSTLMVLSVFIASLGLLADSTAVVIGAMIVAPLMGPILGVAAAAIMGWRRRMWTQLGLLTAGSLGAVGTAALVGYLVSGDPDPLPSEILARTGPSVLDVGVALGAGAVAAYSVVRKQAADAFAGAAIAVALVPPLSSIGILLQLGRLEMAMGAILLFSVNVVGVLLAASVTLLVVGFVPGLQLVHFGRPTLNALRWSLLLVIVVVAPLQLGGAGVLRVPPQESEVAAVVREWSGGDQGTVELVDLSVDTDDGLTTVSVVVASPRLPPPVDQLADSLAAEFERPVEVEVQVVASSSSRAAADS